MANQKIVVDGHEITIKQVNDQDFISLTDIVRNQRPDQEIFSVIQAWLRNRNTILFLEAWERHYNLDFKPSGFARIKLEIFDNDNISVKKYIEETGAVGIQSKPGRYGGTFAHRDIAFEFASWINAEFKLFLIVEFQRLKSDEAKRLNLEFSETRLLTKVNYTLQTKAIEENILPRLNKADKPFAYSNEADLLNRVVFGMTAKQWRETNPEAKGNIRDNASILELNILNNLQSRNAELIDNGVEAELRFRVLLQMAQKQFQRLADDQRLTPPDEIGKIDSKREE